MRATCSKLDVAINKFQKAFSFYSKEDGTVSVENHFMDLTFTAQFGNLANSSIDLPLPASTSQYLVSSSRTLSQINKCAKTQTCPTSMANFSVLSKNSASSASSVVSRCFAMNLNLKIDPYDMS